MKTGKGKARCKQAVAEVRQHSSCGIISSNGRFRCVVTGRKTCFHLSGSILLFNSSKMTRTATRGARTKVPVDSSICLAGTAITCCVVFCFVLGARDFLWGQSLLARSAGGARAWNLVLVMMIWPGVAPGLSAGKHGICLKTSKDSINGSNNCSCWRFTSASWVFVSGGISPEEETKPCFFFGSRDSCLCAMHQSLKELRHARRQREQETKQKPKAKPNQKTTNNKTHTNTTNTTNPFVTINISGASAKIPITSLFDHQVCDRVPNKASYTGFGTRLAVERVKLHSCGPQATAFYEWACREWNESLRTEHEGRQWSLVCEDPNYHIPMTRSLRVGRERSWSSPSGSVLFLAQSGCAAQDHVQSGLRLTWMVSRQHCQTTAVCRILPSFDWARLRISPELAACLAAAVTLQMPRIRGSSSSGRFLQITPCSNILRCHPKGPCNKISVSQWVSRAREAALTKEPAAPETTSWPWSKDTRHFKCLHHLHCFPSPRKMHGTRGRRNNHLLEHPAWKEGFRINATSIFCSPNPGMTCWRAVLRFNMFAKSVQALIVDFSRLGWQVGTRKVRFALPPTIFLAGKKLWKRRTRSTEAVCSRPRCVGGTGKMARILNSVTKLLEVPGVAAWLRLFTEDALRCPAWSFRDRW